MKGKLLGLVFLLYSFASFGQTLGNLSDVKSYFEDGVILEHAPTNTKTKFRFRMQNRFTYETEDTEDLSAKVADFSVRRFRLRLEGNVLDKRLLYRVQLSFTRGDMDFDRTQYPNILRDAVVGWKLTDATTLWYGQTKLPGNRQRVVSSGAQQLVDRSLLNATFNIDRDLGFQVHHRIGEERPFWLKGAISNGSGRATENKNSGLAYTARAEWLPLGKFTNDGDYFEADLARESSPKLSLGAVYSSNKKTTRNGGQIGVEFQNGEERDMETWFGDVLFKYRGFSWASEYARRWAHDPIVTPATSGNRFVIFKGEGFNTQMGYIFDNNVEPSLRYTKLWASDDIKAREADRDQYTLGVSKYFNKHTVKLQSDISYDERIRRTEGTYTNNWTYRLQLEIGI
jgi:phosphate-selective porin OprO and OprP